MAGVDSDCFTGVGGKAVSVRCTGVSGLGGRVARVRSFYGPVAHGTGGRSRVVGYWEYTGSAAVHRFRLYDLVLCGSVRLGNVLSMYA